MTMRYSSQSLIGLRDSMSSNTIRGDVMAKARFTDMMAKAGLTFTIVALLALRVHCAIDSNSKPSPGDCVCATTDVNGRTSGSLSSNVVTVLSKGSCGAIYGGIVTNDGYTWYEVNYHGQRIWVAGQYLNPSSSTQCGVIAAPGNECPSIISRGEWGARPGRHVTYLTHQPVTYAFIHHSDTPSCQDQHSCISRVRSFQNYHMDSKGWSDIGYSFLIGGDGKVYEGRGWDRVGAHTSGYNSVGLGLCFIGDFQTQAPSHLQIEAALRLLACGVSKGKLKIAYTLRGHRDMVNTDCPGDQLYGIIKAWPHY